MRGLSSRKRLWQLVGSVAVISLLNVAPALGADYWVEPDREVVPKEELWQTPEEWDVAPEALESAEIADVSALAEADLAGLDASRSNTLSFAGFKDGDIVVAMQSLSVGHAGIWDARYATSIRAACVWSAVKSSPGCVIREAPLKYRLYDKAYGLYVPSVPQYARTKARIYCTEQIGEPYNIASSKSDQTRWYCSKLVWAGYRYRAWVDLDANGGYWVSPADLYNDSQTRCFVRAS